MSNIQYSKQELAFFEEGETLADETHVASDFDFSDLDDEAEERVNTWVDRARALLSTMSPSRSES
jgi:hypothetical protein